MTSFFFRYSSITGFGTVFNGHEKLTQLGQKNVLRVTTKEIDETKLITEIPINPKRAIKP